MIATCIGCGADSAGIHDEPGVMCCDGRWAFRDGEDLERRCSTCAELLNPDEVTTCQTCQSLS